MLELERLRAAFNRNKERKPQSTKESIGARARAYFAVVTALIAFATSLSALGAFRQLDELDVLITDVPHLSFDKSTSKLQLKGPMSLTFVNAGDRMIAITSVWFGVYSDEEWEGYCYNNASSFRFSAPELGESFLLKSGEIAVKSLQFDETSPILPMDIVQGMPKAVICMHVGIAMQGNFAANTIHVAAYQFWPEAPGKTNPVIEAATTELTKLGLTIAYRRWGTVLSWVHGPETGDQAVKGMQWRYSGPRFMD
jgi:hypothetical protein